MLIIVPFFGLDDVNYTVRIRDELPDSISPSSKEDSNLFAWIKELHINV